MFFARHKKFRLKKMRRDNKVTDIPNIYFMCHDHPTPCGGVRVLYRHVEVLNKNGFPASLVHQKSGYKYKWCNISGTKIEYASKIRLKPNDIVVIPENDWQAIGQFEEGVRKVFFYQNSYFNFT